MRPETLFVLFAVLMSTGTVAGASVDPPVATADGIEYFEKMIRPLLVNRCGECHSSEAKIVQGGLKLDSARELFAGGDSGAVIVPGRPDASLLISAIRYDEDAYVQMPPKGRLPDQEIAELTEWVRRGAPFPADAHSAPVETGKIDFETARRFWSFRPAVEQPLPQIINSQWPRQRLDHFVLRAMEDADLSPSPKADRVTLLRRLSVDLIGLPPTPAEVNAFVQDTRPDAWERQVERLLDSPHFGERWARVWLDLARYTDKTATWLESTGQAYLYRDWVVRAMNDNVPYDEFIHRQLATDLMPDTGPEDIAALGFLGLSPNYWKELKLPAEIIKVIVADEWEERVDAVSRTFLGLTVACARCHDHKFDPLTMQDYYALAGVFASCRITDRPLISEELFTPVRKAREDVAQLEKQISGLKKKKPRPDAEIAQLTARISKLRDSTPYYDSPMVPAVVEESLFVERRDTDPQSGTKLVYRPGPKDLHLFIRGNPNRLGDVIPRRFLQVLSGENPQPFRHGSGRLELARAITTDGASLAARVIVNRIWLAHFGRGLVTTPSNFGQSGERPSHAELLDDLAARFVADGWSLKQLHREMVLSAAYRQSSRADDARRTRDPDNRWLSRMNRRRLQVEAWRDAMLAATRELDATVGGPPVSLTDPANYRRTIYGTIHRREMSTMLLTHDFPDPTAHSPQRVVTTTALQGLYALNGPWILDRSEALANRLARDVTGGESVESQRIHHAYRLLYSRDATRRETEIGLAFLNGATGEDRSTAWPQYAQVLLVSNEFLFVE